MGSGWSSGSFYRETDARDRTEYGTSRLSPQSYLTHHTQHISMAAIRANAKNMRNQIACLKQRACLA